MAISAVSGREEPLYCLLASPQQKNSAAKVCARPGLHARTYASLRRTDRWKIQNRELVTMMTATQQQNESFLTMTSFSPHKVHDPLVTQCCGMYSFAVVTEPVGTCYLLFFLEPATSCDGHKEESPLE